MNWEAVRQDPYVISALQGVMSPSPDEVTLGYTEDGNRIGWPYTVRERGGIFEAASGWGKSRGMAGIGIQDFFNGRCGGIVDPVAAAGATFLNYVGAVITSLEIARKAATCRVVEDYYSSMQDFILSRLHVLDLRDRKQTHTINICQKLKGLTAEETIDAVALPILKKQLGDLTDARRLTSLVKAALVPIVEMTPSGVLVDCLDLLSITADRKRIFSFLNGLDARHQRMRKRDGNIIRRYLREVFLMMPERDFISHTQSTWHALGEIVSHPVCARLFGSPTTTFDIPRYVNDGHYFVVIAPQSLSSAASVVCSAVMQLVTYACQNRDVGDIASGKAHEVFLIVDEAHQAIAHDKSADDLPAMARNWGLRLLYGWQAPEVGMLGENPNLVSNLRCNLQTHVYGRVSLDSAKSYVAEHLWRPRGDRVKRVVEQRTITHGRNRTWSFSRQVGLAVALARSTGRTSQLTLANGETCTVTNSAATTVIESNALSVAVGHNFQEVHGESLSYAQSEGRTTVNGQALGDSKSTGEAQNHGDFVGETSRAGGLTGIPGLEGTGMVHSGSAGASSSRGQSSSLSRQMSNSISKLVSQAVALSQSGSHSQGFSSSRANGRSYQTANTRGLSEALSRTQALGQALSQTVSRGTSESESTTQTRTESQSVSVGGSIGESHSESVREVEELFTLDEQTRILAYELAELSRQHAVMVTDGDDGKREVHRLRIIDVPDVATSIAGIDGMAIMKQRCFGPKAREPQPRDSIFDRGRVKLSWPEKKGGS